jgi:hypothetical protein
MRFPVRVSVLAVLVAAIVAISAPAAQAAFGVESWFAANCKVSTCNKAKTPAEEKEVAEKEGYTQAAGHPPFGITDFKLNRFEISAGVFAPQASVKNFRVDVAPGVSTNPQAVAMCSFPNFTGTELEPIPGLHAFTAPTCPGSEIGTNKVFVVIEVAKGVFKNYTFEGKVYNLNNLEQPVGLSSDFGVALNLEPLLGVPLYSHTFIEGHVEWASDYHDYFVIKNVTPGLIESRLAFKGNIGTGGFLTNPSNCSGTGPQTTTSWHGESYTKGTASSEYTTAIGTEGCNGLAPFTAVPFAPTFALETETTQADQPDGPTTTVTLPHDPNPEHIDSSQLKTVSITLPEGMTLNESAAHGLEACTPAQARIHSTTPGVLCPAGSKVGTLSLNVPGLPEGSLKGSMFLGGPESGPITGPPYTMYLDAESAKYGISVRLKGEVVPNEATGRLTAIFKEKELPEQPFSSAIVHFNTGALAPLANPLVCGTASSETLFSPFTGTTPQSPLIKPFVVDSNGEEGACPSPLPFTPTQSTENQSPNAGGHTSFTVNLTRASRQQYLSQVSSVLPAGLVGAVPAVTLCEEPQAREGTCAQTSRIGVATVEAGAGPAPFTFTGPVYMTGPYNGAPYGAVAAVPAVAGPFNLGTVVTRATIAVNPNNARVTVSATLPRIVKGVLVRIRHMSVAVDKQGFLFNPTNCSALATESTLAGFTLPQSGTTGAFSLSTPFQVAECAKLAFKPTFKASTSGKTSKANGASLETTINQAAGQANIKSVLVQLPKQLPSRLTTLQKACLAATFEANPFSCPSGSFVGGARANTPALPAKMSGPAILVSHANAAFPDLDLVLQGNNVRVILVGNTDIKNGITRTNFAASPDVPVSSVTVNLPLGPNSALAANGNLCASTLIMPTTITGQNGVVFKQNTKLGLTGCGVQIVGHKVIGRTAYLTIRTFAPGRVSGSGSGLSSVSRTLRNATSATSLKIPLSGSGRRRHHPFSTRIRVLFVPKKGARSTAYVTVRFR